MLTEQAMSQSKGPNVRMLVLSFAAALLGSADVRAEQPATTQQHWSAEKILPPEPGRKACWRRVYDAKHLAAHPQQQVTELTFFLRVSGYDAGGDYVFKNPDHIVYNFAISLKRRGNKRALAIGGDCLGDNTVECVVDCDGGGVTIDKLSSDDGLSISLGNDGIAFGGDCYTTRGTWVRPGSDDKVFHLDPVRAEACKTLEKEQLGGWDDEPGR
jgi:hypothetical protein